MVKMKIGRDPEADPDRIRIAREAIGPGVELLVDANGAFSRKQALAMTAVLTGYGVTWYEQPVQLEIASGEYGFELGHFRRMIEAGAVDVVQADATRCGVNGFLDAGALCSAYYLPLSSHCAPALHLHLCCAVERARHMEYFHDHVRIEERLFDGVQKPKDGMLSPDLSRPGFGLDSRQADNALLSTIAYAES